MEEAGALQQTPEEVTDPRHSNLVVNMLLDYPT